MIKLFIRWVEEIFFIHLIKISSTPRDTQETIESRIPAKRLSIPTLVRDIPMELSPACIVFLSPWKEIVAMPLTGVKLITSRK